MKHEAISRRELPKVIHQISATGIFSGVRGGHQVKIARNGSLIGAPIKYAICIARRWHYGQAATVGEAADAINLRARHTTEAARA